MDDADQRLSRKVGVSMDRSCNARMPVEVQASYTVGDSSVFINCGMTGL